MQRTLLFQLATVLITSICSLHGLTCPCSVINSHSTLQCNVGVNSPSVDTTSCTVNGYSLILVSYTGNVSIRVIAPTTTPIVIQPIDTSDSNILQVSSINTNAVRIEIQVSLSSNQLPVPIFAPSSTVVAPNGALAINVMQTVPDSIGFQIFSSSYSSGMNFLSYELIFNTTSTSSGTLSFPDIIRGLTNIPSISISGNNHLLAVNGIQMPLFGQVYRLSLKGLRLYDQILRSFTSLKEYIIEQCDYTETAQFLSSTQTYDLSLEMRNNIPSDSSLLYITGALRNLTKITSLELIEPNLNSTCLRSVRNPTRPENIYLDLNSYYLSDFQLWQEDRPTVYNLNIQNIQNLNIFPSKFFNKLDAITQVTLAGTFGLKKQDICAFVLIKLQNGPQLPIVVFNSSKQGSNDWDVCADLYIQAINQRTTQGIYCLPNNRYADCEQWAATANSCDLISYENSCNGTSIIEGIQFLYNNSYLYNFFQKRLWLNPTNPPTSSTLPPMAPNDPVNISAIIGAVCGLLLAMAVLGATIFCIYRYRQKDSMKDFSSSPESRYAPSAPHEKYAPSSYDPTHVSIATSKTSQSSRYPLNKSFFPPIQPNDEIAPPLYTAPSESVASASVYNVPTARAMSRASVSTHATHVYETLDS